MEKQRGPGGAARKERVCDWQGAFRVACAIVLAFSLCFPNTAAFASSESSSEPSMGLLASSNVLTASVTEITKGGVYIVDDSVTDEHVVYISTSDEVTITTLGEEVESGIVFKYTVEDGNFGLDDAMITRDATGSTQSSIEFMGGDNRINVGGNENSLTIIGGNYQGTKTNACLVEVPEGSSLTFGGGGPLTLRATGSTTVTSISLVGAKSGTLSGSISFEECTINLINDSRASNIVVLGSLPTSSGTVANSDPIFVNFISGRVDIYAYNGRCIESPAGNTDDYYVYVLAEATVNIVSGEGYTSNSNPYVGPVDVGPSDSTDRGRTDLYGSFNIEPGAIVRCYSETSTSYFDQGYDANIIFMNLYFDGEPVVGYTLDATEAIQGTRGFAKYSIDGGDVYTYDWVDTQVGSSYMTDDSAYMLPLYLTKEDHTVVVNDVEYELKWDGTTFSIAVPTFNINYDYAIGDDFLYTDYTEVAKTQFTSAEETFALEEPSLEGYVFDGWYLYETATDGTIVYGDRVESIDPSDMDSRTDFNLVAKWEPLMVEVPYDHWEGGEATASMQYGREVIVDGTMVDDELTTADLEAGFKVSTPEGSTPDEGYQTIGYKAALDDSGNLTLTLSSGMPYSCNVTIVQPEGCEIWAVDLATNTKIELDDNGTFTVDNGTKVGLRAYPGDGYEFNYFTIDGEPLIDDSGYALYTYTATRHASITADVRQTLVGAASIPADATAELLSDANTGLRKAENGIEYRIIKTGIRYVNGVAQYVKDYPVYDGDPLYEGDVLTCIGTIDSSYAPSDPNMTYVGGVRFTFNGGDRQESEATYRVTGEEGAAITIALQMPAYEQKTWLQVADTSWYSSEESIFYLSTPEQFAGIIALMGTGVHFDGQTIVLANDISLENNDGTTGRREWRWQDGWTENSALYSFNGTLDGAGHTVSNAVAQCPKSYYYPSLLGYVRGSVKNLIVSECDLNAADSLLQVYYAGGIAGYLDGGTIENCTVESSSELVGSFYVGGIAGYVDGGTVKDCTVDMSVSGNQNVAGGIVGYAAGDCIIDGCVNRTESTSGCGIVAVAEVGKTVISNCINLADCARGGIIISISENRSVTANEIVIKNCVNHGTVTSSYMAGGIASACAAGTQFINCTNTGSVVVDSSTDNSYQYWAGGIVAYATSASLEDCVNTGDVTIETDKNWSMCQIGGLVGYMNVTTTGASISQSYSTGSVDAGYADDYSPNEYYQCTNNWYYYASACGGLVGMALPGGVFTIENSYAAGSLSWSLRDSDDGEGVVDTCDTCKEEYLPGGLVGGVMGRVSTTAGNDAGVHVIDCYYLTDVAQETMGIETVTMVGRAYPVTVSDTVNSTGACISADVLSQTVIASCSDDEGQVYEPITDVPDAMNLNNGFPVLRQDMAAVGVCDSTSNYLVYFSIPFGYFLTADSLGSLLDAMGVTEDGVLAYEGEMEPGYDYQQIGWSEQQDATTATDLFLATFGMEEAIYVYPVFSKETIEYSLSYERMDDAALVGDAPSSYTVETETFDLPVAERDGDEFLGWYLDEEFSGNPVTQVSAGSTGDLTLYARWASDVADMTVLNEAIAAAQELVGGVVSSNDGSDVSSRVEWATPESIATFNAAIEAAQVVAANAVAMQDAVDAAVVTLNEAVAAFKAAVHEAVVNAASLESALAAAEELLTNTPVSADGKDVANGSAYVNQDAHDALEAAIATAQVVLADEGASQSVLDAAATVLETAQSTFDAAKITAETDTTALESAIAAVRAGLEGMPVSADGRDLANGVSYVGQDTHDALEAAIATAQAVVDDETATQNDIDAAIVALEEAQATFDAAVAVATVDKSALFSAILVAQELVGEVESSSDGSDVSDGSEWATPEDIATFNVAITAAEAVVGDSSATQNAVDGAVATLNEAAAAFETVIGTAEATLAESMFTVDVSDVSWTKTTVAKAITVKDGSKTLVEGTDYTVTYEGNDRPGTATVTITGIGDYRGEQTYSFLIYYPDLPASLASDPTAYYYDSVYDLTALGVMSGYDKNLNYRFGVGDSILRQDVVVMLWRYMCPEDAAAYDEATQAATKNESGLSDVPAGQYYTAAINWAVEEGVVSGYEDGSFGVGDTMTFEQLIAVLVRLGATEGTAESYSTSALFSGGYADASQVSGWAQSSMSWAVEKGLAGQGTVNLLPQSNVERERVATVLLRYIDMMEADA